MQWVLGNHQAAGSRVPVVPLLGREATKGLADLPLEDYYRVLVGCLIRDSTSGGPLGVVSTLSPK